MFSFLRNILRMDHAKQVLRYKYEAEREAAAKARPDAALHAARIFMDNIPLTDDAIIALYYPVRNEMDTVPLRVALAERNYRLALPVVARKNAPLIFRAWSQTTTMEDGLYRIPAPTKDAPEVIPTHIVLPLLGFSSKGGRLGYGGGYYDRTLAKLRPAHPVMAVGYGFGQQHVDHLPVSKLDEPLDWMITEREAQKFR